MAARPAASEPSSSSKRSCAGSSDGVGSDCSSSSSAISASGATSGFKTSGLGTSGLGTSGLGTSGLGTSGLGTSGLGTSGLGTSTLGISGLRMLLMIVRVTRCRRVVHFHCTGDAPSTNIGSVNDINFQRPTNSAPLNLNIAINFSERIDVVYRRTLLRGGALASTVISETALERRWGHIPPCQGPCQGFCHDPCAGTGTGTWDRQHRACRRYRSTLLHPAARALPLGLGRALCRRDARL